MFGLPLGNPMVGLQRYRNTFRQIPCWYLCSTYYLELSHRFSVQKFRSTRDHPLIPYSYSTRLAQGWHCAIGTQEQELLVAEPNLGPQYTAVIAIYQQSAMQPTSDKRPRLNPPVTTSRHSNLLLVRRYTGLPVTQPQMLLYKKRTWHLDRTNARR